MRYISILITLALIAAMTVWYMKSGALSTSQGEGASRVTPQQTVKQAEDAAKILQQTLQQQQQQIEQQK